MKTVCVTGSEGFIMSYVCDDLLAAGYRVIGIDNFCKYGFIDRKHQSHENFTLIRHDLTHSFPAKEIAEIGNVDYIIAGCSKVGGIKFFHKYAYDIITESERILCNTFDYAIDAYQLGYLKRIVYISSSMVYENTEQYPTHEDQVGICPPPFSTYGMQKLMGEYYCKGASEQFGLPYSIVRPFNAVGIGEEDAIEGNTHVLPDFVYKALTASDNTLTMYGDGTQVRHYTHASDVARGVRVCMESPYYNTAFNISIGTPTSVSELAKAVWKEVHGIDPDIKHIEGFDYDVQLRSPDVSKASNMLGFQAKINLESSIEEVVRWMEGKLKIV
jgi:nucleoside-diphosphate-sugar epimerase